MKKILKKFLKKVLPKIPILNNIIYKEKDEKILNVLKEKYNYVISKYNNKENYRVKSNNKVWVMWWQGENEAPEIVKDCISRLKEYSENVTVITKDNVFDFIDIEDYVLDKLDKNIITKTHLSDIIRMKLLAKYGGYWVDSTIFLTDNILKEIEEKQFYTPKLEEKSNIRFVSRGRWCGYFIGGNNVKLYKFVSDFFSEYWKNENKLIDYLLIDYIIYIAYQNIEDIRYMIDNNEINNKKIYILNKIRNKKYNEKFAKKLLDVNSVHKLNYKKYLDTDKENTYYAKIIKRKK